MFQLTFTFRKLVPDAEFLISIHDIDGALPMETVVKNEVVQVKILVRMPNQIKLYVDSPVEVLGANLSYINFNLDRLRQHLIYHPQEQGPVQSLVWDQSGYAILDLFDPDPFTYHLHIGTTIRL